MSPAFSVILCSVLLSLFQCNRSRPVFCQRLSYNITVGFSDVIKEVGSQRREAIRMCRNIRTLYNFEPPATNDEIRAAAFQFVRKISGFATPSAANEEAFNRAVKEVARASTTLLGSLSTNAPPRDREKEAARARQRAVLRFGPEQKRG
jgi:hypothetical protein